VEQVTATEEEVEATMEVDTVEEEVEMVEDAVEVDTVEEEVGAMVEDVVEVGEMAGVEVVEKSGCKPLYIFKNHNICITYNI
jgi:hypothetical protein